MATATAATFQPNNFAGTPGAAGNGSGGALATTGPGGALVGADGAPLPAPGLFAPVQQLLLQPGVKKAMPFILMGLAILLFVLTYITMNAPNYRPIMPGMNEADQQTAFEALKQADFKPVLDSANGQITVPTTRFHEARIFLASKGLPKTSNTGIDSLKDQSAMTTSQFMEQVRYTAAMEQELARTITQIDSIQTARVHLAMPKQSVFVRDRTPPKASIVVTPFPGRFVSPSQVQALVHLVASSVPLMSTENVTVVDNQGKLITDTTSEAALGLTSAQTQHKQKLEDVYRQRVSQILAPIVGDANVRSQVNMSLDFTQTETTTEDFDNRKEGPKTRSEALSEDKNTLKDASGIPGALSNTPPAAPTANTNTTATPAAAPGDKSTTTSRSTRNFELDRSVRHVTAAIGTVERLSVAVVINERGPLTKNEKGEPMDPKPNPYTEDEITRMQSLVRGVVGFNEARGDVVTVIQAKFEPEQIIDMSVPWYKDEVVVNNLKTGLLGLMFVAFIMMVIRPAVMHFIAPPPPLVDPALLAGPLGDGELSEADKQALQDGGVESMEELKAKMMPKKSNISPEMLDTANTYDDKVALVRIIVADDAARVAAVLKNMIKAG
jgi:flagellar M-ring protein FliF